MPPAQDLPTATLGLAAGIALIAVFLALRQWYEKRARGSDLSGADHTHFARQDVRRILGVAILLVIAAMFVVSSRLQPRVNGRPSLVFAELWVLVLALIVALLVLAMIDWAATRTYAKRHRRQLIRESIEAIRNHARQAVAARAKDHTDGPREPPPSP
jgi:UDP-N-acetylmuramyl pentapeptide phosphotransferase/UDP-N-acetylglucosamine-1-phosphate transferase